MKQLRFLLLGALACWAFYSPPPAHATCEVHTTVPTYADLTFVGADLCDVNGNKFVTLSGTSGGGLGTNEAAAPSRSEGSSGSFSFDLAGNARVTMGTLISGEDQTNNLLMTSGGAVRLTQLLGTGGVPSTATDATGTAQILPVGRKTFHGIVTCTGTCIQIQKIYGAFESSATVAKSVLVCTLNPGASVASTTAVDWCVTDVAFSYWFTVTSGTSGTTPLSGIFVQY